MSSRCILPQTKIQNSLLKFLFFSHLICVFIHKNKKATKIIICKAENSIKYVLSNGDMYIIYQSKITKLSHSSRKEKKYSIPSARLFSTIET